MADEAFTKADIDKAVAEAVEKAKAAFDEEVDGLKTKNRELLAKVRAAKEIDPAELEAAEKRAEAAETENAKLKGDIKTISTERDKAVKSLETEQAAARSYALDAELAGAIAEGNVIPSLIPGFKAMMAAQAKADLVDGKYSVMIGDKPARDAIKAMLESEDGKAWRAAPHNSGGGAPGGNGNGGGGKTMTRAEYNEKVVSDPAGTRAFMKDGGKVIDAAA